MNKKNVKFNLNKVVEEQCVPIQLQGPAVCETCPHKDVKNGQEACSGASIRNTGKNAAGIPVPVVEKPKRLPRNPR